MEGIDKQLIFEQNTSKILKRVKLALPQSTLLQGKKGVGLFTAARFLAADSSSQIVRPELLSKQSTTKQIGISLIRELYESTRSKQADSRIIIIDDADMMTLSAQNSFLKLLEEPNQSTKFILTSHTPERLLPTVRSRLQSIQILPISASQTEALLDMLSLDSTRRSQVQFIATGLPAEIYRLSHDEAYFKIAAGRVSTARSLISGTSYDRLVTASKTTTLRPDALLIIESAVELLTRSQSMAAINRIDSFLYAHTKIAGGGNIKLQLARAVL